MSLTVQQIEEEAQKLSEDDRAELTSRLLESFRQKDPDDAEHDRLWAEEALRRNQEIEDGKVQGIPLEEALAELRTE